MKNDQDVNPYRPPSGVVSDDEPAPSHGLASGPLYSAGQVAGATFVGSPLAGFWLMASNYSALGLPDKKTQALAWGVLAMLAVMGIGFVLPDSVPTTALTVGYAIGHRHLAEKMQGDAFEAHLAAGGQKHSSWRVFGIGLAFMAAIVAVIFGVLFMLPESMWL